jgi:hypothetical protein
LQHDPADAWANASRSEMTSVPIMGSRYPLAFELSADDLLD